MAGRFVILEFKDRDAAEVFVANEEELRRRGARAIAMFLKPERFCECADKRRQNASNWAKGKRSGLYLCKVCKKPSIHHQTGILKRLQYVFGFNLIEVEAEEL